VAAWLGLADAAAGDGVHGAVAGDHVDRARRPAEDREHGLHAGLQHLVAGPRGGEVAPGGGHLVEQRLAAAQSVDDVGDAEQVAQRAGHRLEQPDLRLAELVGHAGVVDDQRAADVVVHDEGRDGERDDVERRPPALGDNG
jgi:hypothetical protein